MAQFNSVALRLSAVNCLVGARSLIYRKPFSAQRIVGHRLIAAQKPVALRDALTNAKYLIARRNAAKPFVLLSSPNSGNYAHWLTKALPMLHHVARSNAPAPILIPPDLEAKPFIADCMKMYPEVEFAFFGDEQRVMASELWAPDRMLVESTGMLIGETAQFVKQNHGFTGARGEGDRIYVTRTGRRKIANEPELIRLLQAHDFSICNFGQMTFGQQVRIASSAAVMIGPHGAGLANSMFMPKDAVVIEIAYPMPTPQDPYFFNLSMDAGHRHFFIGGRRLDYKAPLERNEDFTVDLREVKLVLEQFIPQRQPAMALAAR
jgi:capsular polysaccharide biosynthesis protein